MRTSLLISLLLWAVSLAVGQRVEVVGSNVLTECVERTQEVELDSLLRTCLRGAHAAGYLELSIDSMHSEIDVLKLYVHQGPLYKMGKFSSVPNLDSTYGGVRSDSIAASELPGDLQLKAERYVQKSVQRGYPFARVRIENLEVKDSTVSGQMTVWSGPRIPLAGVRFADGAEEVVSTQFLKQYLRLEVGEAYDDRVLARSARRLRQLRYLQLKREPIVLFETGEAYMYLDLGRQKTSRFDFLLGFLPNSESSDGKLLLTGDVTLELENALRRGERLFASFKRLRPEVAQTQIEAAYPFVLGSPFGVNGVFSLHRQQSEWLRLKYEVGGSYLVGLSGQVDAFYDGGTNQALSIDTFAVQEHGQLPEALDIQRNGFGLRYSVDTRVNRLAARKGLVLKIGSAAALRTVTVPSEVLELNPSLRETIDSAEQTTTQLRPELHIGFYKSLGKRTVLLTEVTGAGLFGGERIARNELFQLGGNKLLRGFDELSIAASRYAILTAEYRLLLGNNSYLSAFVDQGATYNRFQRNGAQDYPTGFGAGINVATANGLLSFAYAYGRRNDQPVDWQRAKIHVGYESRF